ncbi:MAG: phenylalanine--tRNA ligase subunit beta [Candidatus Omnitrophica bacterium]|nr:phenylalanine--tRNA ligase subunit beta [Candidatus Omnitrophota bacterium]
MKFNYHSLKRYVDWQGSIEELCDLLNRIGLEVEELSGPGEGREDLVVGEVLEVGPHPNADRLTLCQVSIGTGPPRQIVCGATNHRQGSRVVVVQPGQSLPGDFKIEEREVRGVKSQGMMCSEKELGLGDDHEGIIILPQEATPGERALEYLTNIELSVTPNRPDCLGWIGLARDIAASQGLDYRVPEIPFPENAKEEIPIILDDPEGCPRYLGRIVRGVKIGPSPKWLQDELRHIGLSPINNVVDVTNFVLMECGQPLHAFDLKKLSGPEIHARRAHAGETFVGLNDETYTLAADHLVIADAEKPVALAGVMGGANSEVTEQTTDLLIECAYFNPSRVRRASSANNLSTDSSFRFERGVDPTNLERVIDRCVGLIIDLAGGEATSGIIEAKSEKHLPKQPTITLRTERVNTRIGCSIPKGTQIDLLNRLGCEVEETEKGVLSVKVPGFRPDLEREIDLVEEVARQYGYDAIPSLPPGFATGVGETHATCALERAIRSFLIDRGWVETKSFSFSSPDHADKLGLSGDHPLRHGVAIQNPITADTTMLRTNLTANLLSNLSRNVNYGERDIRIFETGRVYLKDFENLLDCERDVIGLAWLGSSEKHWSAPDRPYDFFDAKGTGEAILKELGIESFQLAKEPREFFHPGQTAQWVGPEGQTLGIVGRVHPKVTEAFDLPSDPLVVEFDVEAIASLVEFDSIQVEPPSPFPAIRRDLSLTVPVETTANNLLDLIHQSETPYLEEVTLFDRYLGEQIGEGNQSLGFRVTYRSNEKTLTDEEIKPIHQDLLKSLNEQLGATQRGM